MSRGLAVIGGEISLHQVPRDRRAHRPAAHAKNVHMIILDALPGGKVVLNETGLAAGNLVGADRSPNTAAANGDAAFYLAGHEPSASTEKARITKLLETKPKLFRSSDLLPKNHALKPFGRSALAELVDERIILELQLHGKKSELVYIHRQHVPRGEPAQQMAAKEAVEERILTAYRDGSTARQRRSIPIADLVQRAGLTASEVRSWIEQVGIPSRRVQLDEGDWAYATEDERAAAIEQGGRKRLYIAIEP